MTRTSDPGLGSKRARFVGVLGWRGAVRLRLRLRFRSGPDVEIGFPGVAAEGKAQGRQSESVRVDVAAFAQDMLENFLVCG